MELEEEKMHFLRAEEAERQRRLAMEAEGELPPDYHHPDTAEDSPVEQVAHDEEMPTPDADTVTHFPADADPLADAPEGTVTDADEF